MTAERAEWPPEAGHEPAPPAVTDYESVLGTIERALDDVDRALVRLDEGTYGTCEICSSLIGDDRLARWPTTRTCADHDA